MELFLELGELLVGEVGPAEVRLVLRMQVRRRRRRRVMRVMMVVNGQLRVMRPQHADAVAHVAAVLQRTTCRPRTETRPSAGTSRAPDDILRTQGRIKTIGPDAPAVASRRLS